MSLANLAGLNPLPTPLSVTFTQTLDGSLSTIPAFTGVNKTFLPTASATAPYYLTTAGLTSLTVAQWNALTPSDYIISGQALNNSISYETGAFTGGTSTTPQTLQYEATPLSPISILQTNQVTLKFFV
jgi:hypothetical protein